MSENWESKASVGHASGFQLCMVSGRPFYSQVVDSVSPWA